MPVLCLFARAYSGLCLGCLAQATWIKISLIFREYFFFWVFGGWLSMVDMIHMILSWSTLSSPSNIIVDHFSLHWKYVLAIDFFPHSYKRSIHESSLRLDSNILAHEEENDTHNYSNRRKSEMIHGVTFVSCRVQRSIYSVGGVCVCVCVIFCAVCVGY